MFDGKIRPLGGKLDVCYKGLRKYRKAARHTKISEDEPLRPKLCHSYGRVGYGCGDYAQLTRLLSSQVGKPFRMSLIPKTERRLVQAFLAKQRRWLSQWAHDGFYIDGDGILRHIPKEPKPRYRRLPWAPEAYIQSKGFTESRRYLPFDGEKYLLVGQFWYRLEPCIVRGHTVPGELVPNYVSKFQVSAKLQAQLTEEAKKYRWSW